MVAEAHRQPSGAGSSGLWLCLFLHPLWLLGLGGSDISREAPFPPAVMGITSSVTLCPLPVYGGSKKGHATVSDAAVAL